MAPKASTDKPAKKGTSPFPNSRQAMGIHAFRTAKSGGGGKKLSAYNRFMKTELARLREKEPNMAHSERYGAVLFDLERDLFIDLLPGSRWLQGTGSMSRNRVVPVLIYAITVSRVQHLPIVGRVSNNPTTS
jgi:hypothetical protein